MRWLRLTALGLGAWLNSQARAAEVTVAVAANFSAPMAALVRDFKQATGHSVVVVTGASGKFYAQIKNGAPFDVLLSADQHKPLQLEREQLTVVGSRFTYALGALVLWSPQPGFVDEQGAVLGSGNFKKLALANPKLAPYGTAAVEVLSQLGLRETTQNRWVMGENIAQTFQFVSTGNAELGFVALAQIYAGGDWRAGSAWVVPQNLYAPIKQDAVLLTRGNNNEAARALLDYLRSEAARRTLLQFGYRVPGMAQEVK